jgi:hypothetical protein
VANIAVVSEMKQMFRLAFVSKCMRNNPFAFFPGLVIGVAAGMFGLAVESWTNDRTPYSRPSLKIMNAGGVHPGGFILFQQSLTPARRCPNETSRVLFRIVETAAGPEVEKIPIPDFNLTPRFDFEQGMRATVRVHLPENTPLGEWFYVRRTEYWCSLLSRMTGPGIEETQPVQVVVR